MLSPRKKTPSPTPRRSHARPGRQPLQSLATVLQSLGTTAGSMVDKMAEHGALVARLTEEPGYLGAVLRSHAAQERTKILLFVDQFEELYTLGITGGCVASPLQYCPDNPNTRAQMAVFLVKTFHLVW